MNRVARGHVKPTSASPTGARFGKGVEQIHEGGEFSAAIKLPRLFPCIAKNATLQAKVRERLAARQRLNAADEKPTAAPAPDAPRQAAVRSPSEDERVSLETPRERHQKRQGLSM